MRRFIGSTVVGVLAAVVSAAPSPASAVNPVIVVTTNADAIDARDGVTSLREAVRTANMRGGR